MSFIWRYSVEKKDDEKKRQSRHEEYLFGMQIMMEFTLKSVGISSTQPLPVQTTSLMCDQLFELAPKKTYLLP